MNSNSPVRLADRPRDRYPLPQLEAGDAQGDAAPEVGRTAAKSWEASELSPSDFADEVARLFRLPRIALPDLLAAEPLTRHFSRRFLRETMAFPFQSAEHK